MSRFLSLRFLRRSDSLGAGKLQEDLFQAHCCSSQFIEVPACFHDSASQISANEFVLEALHLEYSARLLLFFACNSTHAGDLFEPLLNTSGIQRAVSSRHFNHPQPPSPPPPLQ